jgi:multidrug efflux pump subunit AcrB
MDVSNVPNEINGTKDNILVSTFETNSPENFNSTVSTPHTGTEKGKLHHVIVGIIIALFFFIVVYCLFMQIWWILVVLAIPLLRKAMLKIIDRYV